MARQELGTNENEISALLREFRTTDLFARVMLHTGRWGNVTTFGAEGIINAAIAEKNHGVPTEVIAMRMVN